MKVKYLVKEWIQLSNSLSKTAALEDNIHGWKWWNGKGVRLDQIQKGLASRPLLATTPTNTHLRQISALMPHKTTHKYAITGSRQNKSFMVPYNYIHSIVFIMQKRRLWTFRLDFCVWQVEMILKVNMLGFFSPSLNTDSIKSILHILLLISWGLCKKIQF